MGQPYKPCRYWVKNDSIIHEEGQEYTNVMQVEGMCSLTNTLSTRTGGRPVLLLSSNASIPTNGNAGKRAEDGILEVEYGYYPQTAVAKDVQEILETKYNGKYLYTTGNTYTINKKRRPKGCFFEEESLEEYEYNGKRYIKVKLPWKDHNTWFKVEPVKWLVDDKAKLMLAEKIIFTDVPYDIAKYTDVRNFDEALVRNFDEVLVKKFMDIYLAGELVQSKGIQSKIIISQTRQKKNLLDSKSKIGTSTATQNKDLSDSELSTEETSTTTQNKNLSDSELITEETDTTTQDIIPSDLEFDQVSEEDIIRTAIESNVAIFLHGEPGCGKSDRVKQLDPDFIELNLSHLDPELLDGLAGEKEGKEIHIKPPWLEELETKCKEEPDKIHILFLEEITNASYTMQSKAYGIALDKKVAGRWKLPENARVVAAGNEEEDSLLANEVARPLYDRFAHVNIKTTVDGWLKWALTPEEYYERLDYKKPEAGREKIHPAIYAYIDFNGDGVLRTPYNTEKPEPHADPRRWKMASDMLYTSRNPSTLRAIIGEELTKDFMSFCMKIPMSTIMKNRNPLYSKIILEASSPTQNTTPHNLKFDQVSEEDIIRAAIESNIAIFLHGEPGCGKSDRVKQLDPDFIELNLSHLDPELLDGLAGEKEGKEIHIKPPWLEELETKCKEEPDKIHILFLEEITNASYTMQSKAYGIALDKKVAGRWKLPENARVVAAGNEEEDSLLANEVARPLYDRFAHVNIKTTVDGWLKWALTPEEYYERLDYKKPEVGRAKIHPLIYAYIESKGDEVLRTPYDKEKPEPHSDPRRWKMASDMLYTSRNPNTLRAIIGEKLTRDFISFCLIQTISLQDVINGNYSEKELNEMGFERKLATVSGLVKVDEENMPKVRAFAKKLGAEMCRKFEVQWAGGNEERLEKIQELRMIDKAIERY